MRGRKLAASATHISILPSEIIQCNIISRLLPQELATFRLVSRECCLLARNERRKQKLVASIHHELNNFIRYGISKAKNKGGLDTVIAILERALQKEYVKTAKLEESILAPEKALPNVKKNKCNIS